MKRKEDDIAAQARKKEVKVSKQGFLMKISR